ncbi:MAG TPA: hypothetical protein VG672_24255, partial [Bryobacteraceae bacterium]|nr:hypothetical protein [Bryobacteraceae bacterium]
MKFSIALLCCAAALAQAPHPPRESLNVSGNLSGMLERYLTVLAEDCWEQRAARVASIRTPAEAAARRDFVRAKMIEELGGFPEKTPLRARVTGRLEREGYHVEKVIYESQPGYYVTANLYVPAGSGPRPAVLGTAGHSAGGKAY